MSVLRVKCDNKYTKCCIVLSMLGNLHGAIRRPNTNKKITAYDVNVSPYCFM